MSARQRCYFGSTRQGPRCQRGAPRSLEPVANRPGISLRSAPGIAPLLSKLLAQQAATGLPPPYLPMEEVPSNDSKESSL